MWLPKTPSDLENTEVPIIREILVATTMSSLFVALFALVASSFRTRAALQAEILALRHQMAVFQKNAPRRLRLQRCDRLLWVLLYRFWSSWRRCLQMVQPDTVLRWHRSAFTWHWTRKSRRLPGRPEVAANIRDLIRRMRQANPLWGAPRIHGELLKLGIAVAQSTVARYLPRPRKPPSQTWRTFLADHLAQTTAIFIGQSPSAEGARRLSMLERCFVHPETLDRIRSSWLGPAIERYAAWLCERGYRVGTLATRVSILRQFGTFAQTHGAKGYEELTSHLEPFLQFWGRRPHPRRASDSPLRVARYARVAIEQMLRVVVPGFVGQPRRRAVREPFADRAPGFSTHLRHERGLRDATLNLYDEHLRAFAAYLTDLGREDLQDLSPAVGERVSERAERRP